ncbi:MAG TPA: HDIG domain-containing protein [Prolixibacteraceae bacterium]|nr:HDIG domain-containing protein [Prolixibacteraceae bacterium]
MNREEALQLLHQKISSENMRRHSYASEAVLRALARHFGENEERWGIAGLLHDIDSEQTQGDMHAHGIAAKDILTEKVDADVLGAIMMHNEIAAGKARETLLEHALAAGETLTGLITATALVYPDKKLASVTVKSITKRMKEKAFAASVNRETILECEKIGLSLDEFAALALGAMQSISDELGL